MNELKGMERDEAREIHRVLREKTSALRPHLLLLEASQESLVVFGSLYARARAAMAWEGRAPVFLRPGSEALRVLGGRHPLLLARGQGTVVPFDLVLEPGERAVVVSGPNTGGKSVLLKALGLIAALSQSGVIPPVGQGTRLPFFTNIFADIGDEQSIAESLSTFSAHLSNLKQIVMEADSGSLVLIDEMGTGTDPQEGAALSRAIIEALVRRGALTVVTSEPTYQLLKGRPGRSYGLAIARRLGFSSDLLDQAEGHLPRDEARMEDLLSTLERREKEASTLVDSLSREKARADRLGEELRAREAELRNREETAESRAREEARRLLLGARKEVEAAIRDVRAAAAEEAVGSEAARSHLASETASPGTHPARDFEPGDRVALAGSGAEGSVVEVRDDRVVVETAGVRLQVPAGELRYKGLAQDAPLREGGNPAAAASSWQGPDAEAEAEVDLRGMRVAEVDLALDRSVDQAVLGGLGELRVIHGKGTGALRERVAELLARDPRVMDFRIGLPSEGGAGVTVVKLK